MVNEMKLNVRQFKLKKLKCERNKKQLLVCKCWEKMNLKMSGLS